MSLNGSIFINGETLFRITDTINRIMNIIGYNRNKYTIAIRQYENGVIRTTIRFDTVPTLQLYDKLMNMPFECNIVKRKDKTLAVIIEFEIVEKPEG